MPAEVIVSCLTDAVADSTAKSWALKVRNCQIRGSLDLEHCRLTMPLHLEGCHLPQPIVFTDGLAQSISLVECKSSLVLASRLRCEGHLDLRGLEARLVDLSAASVDRGVVLRGADLSGSAGKALDATTATIGTGLDCTKLTAGGEVCLIGAQIAGQLRFTGASLKNSGGYALVADGVVVESRMACDNAFAAEGEVCMIGARIDGQLDLTGGSFKNRQGTALNAAGSTVGSSMFCQMRPESDNVPFQKFRADGEIRLEGIQIGRDLVFIGACLSNAKGIALDASGAVIGGDVDCCYGDLDESPNLEAVGQVNLVGAEIGAGLLLSGARLSNDQGIALDASASSVRYMFCRKSRVEGEVRLIGATVRGQLSFDDASLKNPLEDAAKGYSATGAEGFALSANGLEVNEFFYRPREVEGGIWLSGANAERFTDAPGVWQQSSRSPRWLAGFTYGRLVSREGDTLVGDPGPPDQRIAWVRGSSDQYEPSAYDELIACYRRMGCDQYADAVAVAKERERRRVLGRAARTWSWMLDQTIRYGYGTHRAVIGLVALFAVGWAVFALGTEEPLREMRPEFQPLTYSLDVLLPIVDLGQRSAYTATGIAAWFAWISTLAGWILVTIVAAALAGLLRRG